MTVFAPYDCGESDMNCPGDTVCYSGEIDWIRRDYGVKENEQVCICDPFYRQSGENCSNFGWGSDFSLVFYSLLALVALIPSLVLINSLAHYKRVVSKGELTPLFWTSFSVIAGLVGLFLRNVTEIFAVRTPTNWIRNPFDASQKLNLWRGASQFFFGLAMVFQFISAARIVLEWVDVINKSSSLRLTSGASVVKIKRAVKYFQVLLISVFSPLIILQQYFIVAVVILPCAIFIAVAYTWGAIKLTELMKTMLGTANKAGGVVNPKAQRAMVALIRKTAVIVVAGSWWAILFGAAYGVLALQGVRKHGDPSNKFPYILLLAKGPETGFYIVLLAIFWFLLGPLNRLRGTSNVTTTKSGGTSRPVVGLGGPFVASATPSGGGGVAVKSIDSAT